VTEKVAFNVVVYWDQGVLCIEPTALKCDNLIPLKAFEDSVFKIKMYTTYSGQVDSLRSFPLPQIAAYLSRFTLQGVVKRRLKK